MSAIPDDADFDHFAWDEVRTTSPHSEPVEYVESEHAPPGVHYVRRHHSSFWVGELRSLRGYLCIVGPRHPPRRAEEGGSEDG